MNNLLHTFVMLAMLPLLALSACSYYDTSNAPKDPQLEQGVETIDLMAGDHAYVQRDVREVVYSATGGSVEVFSLDGGLPPAELAEQRADKLYGHAAQAEPLVSSVESNGLKAEDMMEVGDEMVVREVEPAKTALPGGYQVAPSGSLSLPRSMDPSVEVYGLN